MALTSLRCFERPRTAVGSSLERELMLLAREEEVGGLEWRGGGWVSIAVVEGCASSLTPSSAATAEGTVLFSSEDIFAALTGVDFFPVDEDVNVPGSGLAFLLLARRENLDLSQPETFPGSVFFGDAGGSGSFSVAAFPDVTVVSVCGARRAERGSRCCGIAGAVLPGVGAVAGASSRSESSRPDEALSSEVGLLRVVPSVVASVGTVVSVSARSVDGWVVDVGAGSMSLVGPKVAGSIGMGGDIFERSFSCSLRRFSSAFLAFSACLASSLSLFSPAFSSAFFALASSFLVFSSAFSSSIRSQLVKSQTHLDQTLPRNFFHSSFVF